jgi:alpha-glucoside transport system permease protein
MGATVVSGIVAIVAGVVGVFAVFWLLNQVTERVGGRFEELVKPWVFFGPALLIVTVFLIYPLIDTVRASFYGNRFVEGERPFVGLDNYRSVLTNSETWVSLGNNLQWIIVVPLAAVIIGLVVAVLADRLPARSENVTKSIIFVPMAISFVGAAAIWQLIYAIQPPSRNQTGLLNALLGVFGIPPVAWYENTLVNDFALMAIMIWLQAGFAMVLLSAAIKNVPADTIEAARIDGATEAQIFFRVVLPQIASTIVVVLTTILILVLKVFDIVRVTTNGRANTQVIANYFYTFFEGGNYGSAGVVVVLLVLVTIPFMFLNIRRFRAQEAMR